MAWKALTFTMVRLLFIWVVVFGKAESGVAQCIDLQDSTIHAMDSSLQYQRIYSARMEGEARMWQNISGIYENSNRVHLLSDSGLLLIQKEDFINERHLWWGVTIGLVFTLLISIIHR